MEMNLTGERITAEDALRRGLVSKVRFASGNRYDGDLRVLQIFPADQLLDETIKTAEKIAANSPIITAIVKEAVNRSFETTLQEGLLYERRMFHLTFGTVSEAS